MRLPETILQLRLRDFKRSATAAEVDGLVNETMQVAERDGARAANQVFIDRIGLEVIEARDEPYYVEALHYHLGLVCGMAGQAEKMAEHIRQSHTMPTPDDHRVFSDAVNMSIVIRDWQLRAIKRGLPPILIACMPRAASGTLTQTLSHALDMPAVHLSIGQFPNHLLAPSWLEIFLEGGALTQDHFEPNEHNVGLLAARRVEDVFVLIRDPRAAAWSVARLRAELSNQGKSETRIAAAALSECVNSYVPWLQAWLKLSQRSDLPLRIHWLTFLEVKTGLSAILRRIAHVLSARHPAMLAYMERTEVEEIRSHFVRGDDDAWRAGTSRETQGRMWQACSPEIRELLHLPE